MTKKKFIFLTVLITAIACLIVIMHIPVLSWILGGEKVFAMRGTFLIITPALILVVSTIAAIFIELLDKKYKKSQQDKVGENKNNKSKSIDNLENKK